MSFWAQNARQLNSQPRVIRRLMVGKTKGEIVPVVGNGGRILSFNIILDGSRYNCSND